MKTLKKELEEQESSLVIYAAERNDVVVRVIAAEELARQNQKS